MLTIVGMTHGQTLRIQRRREKKTQAQAAQQLGMPLDSYKQAEADKAPECWDIAFPEVDELTGPEYCFLMRRRAGLTLAELAPMVGVRKEHICLMEKGKAPPKTLIEYWTAQ